MRIADEYLNCSIYLYPDEASAKSGRWAGGSGFLVHSQWYDPNRLRDSLFVVTNRHVIEGMRGEDPYLRLNLKSGGIAAVRTNIHRWQHHPEEDDISAYEFHEHTDEHEVLALEERAFLRSDLIVDHNIGIGDEVAMIGRLVEHDGKIRNSPCARFGMISMMPGEGLKSRFKDEQETFLLDCWSLAGFSGSPVILFMPQQVRGSAALLNTTSWVLGINWMHVTEDLKVRTNGGGGTNCRVSGNTGVAGVIPAWRIKQLLDVMKHGVARMSNHRSEDVASIIQGDFGETGSASVTEDSNGG